jgi:hypothetical protein
MRSIRVRIYIEIKLKGQVKEISRGGFVACDRVIGVIDGRAQANKILSLKG